MDALSERLEVRVSRNMMNVLQHEAKERNISMAQLVRNAIRQLVDGDRSARIRAARELFEIEAPVADWPEMEREIEAGRVADIEQR